MSNSRRRLPPGAKWVTLPSKERRVELVADVGMDPATGKRKQTRRRYRTVEDAIEAYNKIKNEAREGTYVGRSGITVEQVCDNWLAGRRGIRPSTLAGYRNWLKPVIAVYGSLPAQKLTKRHLDDLIPLLVAGKLRRRDGHSIRAWSARSVNAMLGALDQVLDDAVRQGLVTRNVAALVDRLGQSRRERDTYTPAEVKKVLAVCRQDRLEVAWHLALYGLRRGEIAGLRWSDIDFKAKTLTIDLTRVTVDGRATESMPKTERGKRTLPLTNALLKVLLRARRRQAEERLRAGTRYQDSGYVIVNESGAALYPDTLSGKWDELTEAAKVRRITLHEARHTCGTLMHLQGVPVAVISAWLGHATADFTMRTYVHSQNDALRSAAAALEEVSRAKSVHHGREIGRDSFARQRPVAAVEIAGPAGDST
jgi:integrase